MHPKLIFSILRNMTSMNKTFGIPVFCKNLNRPIVGNSKLHALRRDSEFPDMDKHFPQDRSLDSRQFLEPKIVQTIVMQIKPQGMIKI